MNGADAVPKGRAIIAAYAADRAMVDRKDDRVAAVGVERFGARLLSRALLAKDKLAAVKLLAALAQKHSKLKRKDDLAIEILMQTVEIAGAVFQEQRRWPFLT